MHLVLTFRMTPSGSDPQAETVWLQRITTAWQAGDLSNLDYLLYLNLVSRSFHDLTQYPVFPWVLTDYRSAQLDLEDAKSFRDLSLPMGALTPARLQVYRQRYWDMPREEVRQEINPPPPPLPTCPLYVCLHSQRRHDIITALPSARQG